MEKIGANANIKVIGITGSISSGKSTLLKVLSKMGFTTLSVDNILDNLYKSNQELKEKVVATLGKDVLSNQLLNKKRIAEIVFNHKELLHKLELLTTPFVLNEIKKVANEAKRTVAVEFPLIFELSLQELFDLTIFVKSDETKCKERTSLHDHDLRSQRLLRTKDKESLADMTITNNGTIAQFTESIKSSMKGLI